MQCRACKYDQFELWLANCPDVYMGSGHQVDYVRCKSCATIQLQNVPENLIETSYENYPIHQKKSSIFNFVRKLLTGDLYFRGKKLKNAALLDFGSGDGFYLSTLSDGPKTKIGFEVSQKHAEALENSLKIPIYSSESKLISDFEDKIDVMTMHMVLEHLPSLEKAFALAAKLLKKNGVFYFVIPNAFSWEMRLFKRYWHCLDAPRHISFPSTDGVSILAKSSGFEIVQKKFKFFPNGVAGSLAAFPTFKFSALRFYLMLPIGIIAALINPSGVVSYELKKN